MSRVFNFSAGPAMLPAAVLKQAAEEMLDWHGIGSSIMEVSHRGKEFVELAAEAEQDLRDLMQIPNHYRVLFLQGGATMQFAMVPLNLLRGKVTADYINTGAWSEKAIAEAKRFCQVNVAANSEDSHFTTIPDRATWVLNPEAAYVHYTANETIGGVEFDDVPEVNGVPLVADYSSSILSRPIDIEKFALIYAGAQKNIGPAGITVVIVRDDLIGQLEPNVPSLFDYAGWAKSDSMLNTPPTYAWYLAGLVFKWIKAEGGLAEMAVRNARKASKLYSYIDRSGFYQNPVDPVCRSRMNVPFVLADNALDADFLKGAEARGFMALKGHRSVGGMRASLYNAMPEAGVDALIEYMREFATERG